MSGYLKNMAERDLPRPLRKIRFIGSESVSVYDNRFRQSTHNPEASTRRESCQTSN